MGGKTVTKEKFVARAILKHGDIYDYSNINYINSTFDVTIYCKKHDCYFTQKASQHFIYGGCNHCTQENKKITSIKNRELRNPIISRFKNKHGEKYDYSKIDINNTGIDEKGIIICPIHGEFEQILYVHINSGCPKCGKDQFVSKKTKSVNEFINKAKVIHGDQYDYSNIRYLNLSTKISIKCIKHNKDFLIKPKEHINKKQGCPLCSSELNISKGENFIKTWLEENNITFIKEKKFPTCKNILPLRFDFYIPVHNLLIEFDGEQHFKKRNHWKSGINKFITTQKRDKIKNDWAQNNGYDLLRISYKEVNKIPTILALSLGVI